VNSLIPAKHGDASGRSCRSSWRRQQECEDRWLLREQRAEGFQFARAKEGEIEELPNPVLRRDLN
jgi:hypothetical protein